jgi:UPF0716 protein FxsA
VTAIKWLLLIIVVLPFLELAAFVAVAVQIGLSAALLLLLASSLVGAVILRYAPGFRHAGGHSVHVASRLRSVLIAFGPDARPWALTLLGGFLLLIPGFITDVAGILLLMAALWRSLAAPSPTRAEDVVDLEPEQWHRVPDPQLPPDRERARPNP